MYEQKGVSQITESLNPEYLGIVPGPSTAYAANPSQNLRSLFTRSLSGSLISIPHCSLVSAAAEAEAASFSLRENLQTITPTPPSPRGRELISLALRSNHTLNPAFICSLSTRLFLSTNCPATPVPSTNSPDRRSYLQHSTGILFSLMSEESFGRRESWRERRMRTSDQCSLRAATCVRVRWMVESGG